MAFYCRICTSKFVHGVDDGGDDSIESTVCGHLFHRKCLSASITNQKLSHARSGVGPFRRYCPAYQCNKEIPENGTIHISMSPVRTPGGEEVCEGEGETEIKLGKRIAGLTSDRDSLQKKLYTLENENECYRETIEEIKSECQEIAAFLLDDKVISKGDRVFWITKENAFAPGRVLEIRRRIGSGTQEMPIVVIKLDNKIQMPALGTERLTTIVPLTEVLTFKSYFKDAFNDFRHKLWKILNEANDKLQNPDSIVRTKPQGSGHSDNAAKKNSTSSYDSHETMDFIAMDDSFSAKAEQTSLKRRSRVSRTKSMSIGVQRSVSISEEFEPKTPQKYNPTKGKSQSPVNLWKSFSAASNNSSSAASSNDHSEGSSNYITLGERVIYYDPTSKLPQIGNVASVLKYTPCAIVKFDETPEKADQLKFRTVPLDGLFPYALASVEEKLKIAEVYGKVNQFMQDHVEELQDASEDESDLFYRVTPDDEEYFSTSSTDEIYLTIHEV